MPQRASAALRALSARSSGVMDAARALPPASPPRRPSATAAGLVAAGVLAAFPFADEADAIALANGTDYGLLAAVWTENGGRQHRVSKAVRCGQVFVNCYGAGGGVELPFGGVKRSGHGREKGFLALEEMSTTKTLVHFHG